MTSISLTGASGFLGWHLAERFRDAGWRVRGVVRPGSARLLPAGVDRVEAALDAEALARAVEGSDVFVHAAGVARAGSDAGYERANVAGTRAAVIAANAAGARLVYVSSQAAAGSGTLDRPSREDDPPAPVTGYGRSKLAAEQEVLRHARVPWTIVRPVSIYGPRDRQFLSLYRMASRGFFPLAAHPDAAFSLIHVSDVVRAMAAVIDRLQATGHGLQATGHGLQETLFLAHPQPVLARDLLQTLAVTFGRPFKPTAVPVSVLRILARAGDLSWKLGRPPLFDSSRFLELRGEGFVCSVERAADRLGFRAEVDLAEGTAATARWYRAEGWL